MAKQYAGNTSWSRTTKSGSVRVGYGRSARTVVRGGASTRSKKYW